MAADTASRRILIVDDDRASRYILAGLLEAAGHIVDQAADGREAMGRLDASVYDIVLLDVGLPDISGLDVLAYARAAASPPIAIMMTADDTPETMLAAIREQAYRYILKPVMPDTIVEVIDDAIDKRASAALPIEVVSARPEWVELVVPCVLEMADRIQLFVMQLDTTIPQPVRESVGQAFRELMTNAIEWGGKLDPQRKVRIARATSPSRRSRICHRRFERTRCRSSCAIRTTGAARGRFSSSRAPARPSASASRCTRTAISASR